MRQRIVSYLFQSTKRLKRASSQSMQSVASTPFMDLVVRYLNELSTGSSLSKIDILKRIQQIPETNIMSLHRSMPEGPDVLYRGTEGRSEIVAAFAKNILGRDVNASHFGNYDLVTFIEKNVNNNFLSATPCPYTVPAYAAGLSLIPTDGFVIALGLPKVFTKPQKLLHLNPRLFELYDQENAANIHSEDGRALRSIIPLAQNNIEWTIITRGPQGEDWQPRPSSDIMKLIHVCGPGRMLQPFMSSSELLHVDELVNEQFKKRVFSMEVVMCENRSDLEGMNDVASKTGLILPESRLLTLEDAAAIMNMQDLEEYNATHEISETIVFDAVPREIRLGDQKALTEYVIETCNQKASKTQPKPSA